MKVGDKRFIINNQINGKNGGKIIEQYIYNCVVRFDKQGKKAAFDVNL